MVRLHLVHYYCGSIRPYHVDNFSSTVPYNLFGVVTAYLLYHPADLDRDGLYLAFPVVVQTIENCVLLNMTLSFNPCLLHPAYG